MVGGAFSPCHICISWKSAECLPWLGCEPKPTRVSRHDLWKTMLNSHGCSVFPAWTCDAMTTTGDTVDTFDTLSPRTGVRRFSRVQSTTIHPRVKIQSLPSNPRLCLIWVFKRPKGIYVLAVRWGPWKKSTWTKCFSNFGTNSLVCHMFPFL